MFKKFSRLITIIMIVALALSMFVAASATPPRTVSLHLSGDAYGDASSLTLVSGGATYTFTRPGSGAVWKNDNETLGVGSSGFTATVTVNGHTYTGVSFTVNGGGNGQDSGSTASDEFWATINAVPTTKQLSYTVEYYKDGVHVTGDDILVTKTVDIAATTLLLNVVNYAPADKYTGFHFSSMSPDITSATEVTGGTIIKVYYVHDEGPTTKELSYTVEYYKDGVHVTGDDILVTKTVDIAATTLLLNVVNYAPADKYTGFHFSSMSPDITSATEVTGGTIIKVYYVHDEGPTTKELSYTVEYYKDGVHVTGDDILVTKTVDIAATTLLLNEENYAPSDKYTGFHFSSMSPDITEETSVTGGTVIKVYYVGDGGPNETLTYTLTVNWVSDVGTELFKQATSEIAAGNPYTTTQRSFAGYSFKQVTGDAVSGTMDGNKTVTYVYTENTPLIIDIPNTVPPLIDNPPADIPEETPPLADVPQADIPEETPPLSDSPQTGDLDNVAALGALLLASAFGIAVLTFGKKKEEQ